MPYFSTRYFRINKLYHDEKIQIIHSSHFR